MKKTSIIFASQFTFRELRTFRSLQLFQEYISNNLPNKKKIISTSESNAAIQTYTYSFYGNAEAISPIQRRRLRAEATGVAKPFTRSVDQSAVIAKTPQQVKLKLSLFPTKRGSLLHAYSPFHQTRSLRKATLLHASFIYVSSENPNISNRQNTSINLVAFNTIVNQSSNTLTLLQSILFYIPTVVKGSSVGVNHKSIPQANIHNRPNRRFGG